MEQHIIPECYIDTRLIKTLEPPRNRYNHQHGCWNVEKTMKRLKGDFALGVIDKDKRAIKYLDECKLICEQDGFLQLFKHRTENHYLILIKPAMEKWILNTTASAGLSMSDFDLPDDLDKLCDITKTAKGDSEDANSSKFVKLFKALKQANPPSIAVLKLWVSYLKDNPYTADMDQLSDGTNQLINPL